MCRDEPTLLPELERRIGILRAFDGLRADSEPTTGERQPASTENTLAGDDVPAVSGVVVGL